MILLSTAYLPSVAYMATLAQHDQAVIELHETFPKQTFRNRAVIATGNGLQTLTVPVVRTQGNHTLTNEIAISYQEPWQIRHWRAIVSAYNAAPYFLYYRDQLEHLLLQHYDRLVDLNDAVLALLLKKLKIGCQIAHSADYTPSAALEGNDLRLTLTAKHSQAEASLPPYCQVFDTKYGFQSNLSVLDLLFNLGPEAHNYLMKITL